MNSIKLWTTTPGAALAGPSCFGMPFGGHAATASPIVARERGDIAATGTKRDVRLAQSYFPGTSAWRPPSC